jgi:uncharacterized membrane protein (DUF485 family)
LPLSAEEERAMKGLKKQKSRFASTHATVVLCLVIFTLATYLILTVLTDLYGKTGIMIFFLCYLTCTFVLALVGLVLAAPDFK